MIRLVNEVNGDIQRTVETKQLQLMKYPTGKVSVSACSVDLKASLEVV